jgi:hypothetical protein
VRQESAWLSKIGYMTSNHNAELTAQKARRLVMLPAEAEVAQGDMATAGPGDSLVKECLIAFACIQRCLSLNRKLADTHYAILQVGGPVQPLSPVINTIRDLQKCLYPQMLGGHSDDSNSALRTVEEYTVNKNYGPALARLVLSVYRQHTDQAGHADLPRLSTALGVALDKLEQELCSLQNEYNPTPITHSE